ncbi:MAG: DUF177 domain-containing protein [Ruminococcaceae bacterium]|nr:DUF177 domain-containing protein [Oscillospiraceae bacterium]MBQ8899262.1 DUF177 domain-containing protein [Clostridia bacterium]
MLLNIRSVLSGQRQSIPIRYDADFRDYDFYGVKPFPAPVSVEGSVDNSSGVVMLELRICAVAETRCASCGKSISVPMDVPVSLMVVTSEPDNDDYDELVICEDGELELDDTVNEAITFAMDLRPLCKEDCKGVCFGCGADLNREPCRCAPRINPELEKLRNLF